MCSCQKGNKEDHCQFNDYYNGSLERQFSAEGIMTKSHHTPVFSVQKVFKKYILG